MVGEQDRGNRVKAAILKRNWLSFPKTPPGMEPAGRGRHQPQPTLDLAVFLVLLVWPVFFVVPDLAAFLVLVASLVLLDFFVLLVSFALLVLLGLRSSRPRSAGKVTRTRVPSPIWLSNSRTPPCNSTSRKVSVRPKPIPS